MVKNNKSEGRIGNFIGALAYILLGIVIATAAIFFLSPSTYYDLVKPDIKSPSEIKISDMGTNDAELSKYCFSDDKIAYNGNLLFTDKTDVTTKDRLKCMVERTAKYEYQYSNPDSQVSTFNDILKNGGNCRSWTAYYDYYREKVNNKFGENLTYHKVWLNGVGDNPKHVFGVINAEDYYMVVDQQKYMIVNKTSATDHAQE